MTRLLTLAVLLAASFGIAPASFAAVFSYQAILNGPSESPANGSPGTGFALVDYNNVAHTLHVNVTFSGLTGTTTASHIHSATSTPLSGTAGVATTTPTFAGFPLGVTSGSYDNILDETLSSSWNPAFVTANGGSIGTTETNFAASLAAGTAYLNIHTSTFGGGEIRGFLVPVPEPASFGLLAAGGLALLIARRAARRRG